MIRRILNENIIIQQDYPNVRIQATTFLEDGSEEFTELIVPWFQYINHARLFSNPEWTRTTYNRTVRED